MSKQVHSRPSLKSSPARLAHFVDCSTSSTIRLARESCKIEFGRLNMVHFMRWFVLEMSQLADGTSVPACLVLETNFDEPFSEHLLELIRVSGTAFDDIYQYCEGYTPGQNELSKVDFLKKHAQSYAAFYIGTRGRSVGQIRREAMLRSAIEEFLNQYQGPQEVAAIRTAIQNRIENDPAFAWLNDPLLGTVPQGIPLSRIGQYLKVVFAFTFIALLALSILLGLTQGLIWGVLPLGGTVLLLGGFYLTLRLFEIREPLEDVSVPVEDIGKLVAREDDVVQNQLSNVVLVKPTWFRRTLARVVLSGIDLLGRITFVQGALGGIPSIHFARWVFLDRGRRLLFMSNFDGSWENYLGDFIDKASVGLTAIWSNTIGCPRARNLIQEGAADEKNFKTWVRRNQVTTQMVIPRI